MGDRRGPDSRGQEPEQKGIKKYREQGQERFLTSEELARLGDTLREGETLNCPIPLTKPSRQPSTLRRQIIGASNLTDMLRLPFGS